MRSPAIQVEHERVATDLSCLYCGYNLRTLSTSAKCPECGNPVFESFRRTQLATADPEWVRLVYDDLGTMLGTGVPAAFLVPGLWGALVLEWLPELIPCVLVGSIATLLHMAAISQFVLHVSKGLKLQRRNQGWFPWYFMLIFPVCLVTAFAFPWLWAVVPLWLGVAALPLFPVFMAGAAQALGNLAGRDDVVRLARFTRWAGVTTTSLILAGFLIPALGPIRLLPGVSAGRVAMVLLFVAAMPLGAVTLSVLSIVLMIRLRRRVRQVIQPGNPKGDSPQRGHDVDFQP